MACDFDIYESLLNREFGNKFFILDNIRAWLFWILARMAPDYQIKFPAEE